MIQDKSNPNDHPPHEYEAVNLNLWVFRTFKYNKAWITKFITVSRCNLRRSQDPQPRYYCSFSKNINSRSVFLVFLWVVYFPPTIAFVIAAISLLFDVWDRALFLNVKSFRIKNCSPLENFPKMWICVVEKIECSHYVS